MRTKSLEKIVAIGEPNACDNAEAVRNKMQSSYTKSSFTDTRNQQVIDFF